MHDDVGQGAPRGRAQFGTSTSGGCPAHATPSGPAPPHDWAAEMQRLQALVGPLQQEKHSQPGLCEHIFELQDLRWEVEKLGGRTGRRRRRKWTSGGPGHHDGSRVGGRVLSQSDGLAHRRCGCEAPSNGSTWGRPTRVRRLSARWGLRGCRVGEASHTRPFRRLRRQVGHPTQDREDALEGRSRPRSRSGAEKSA